MTKILLAGIAVTLTLHAYAQTASATKPASPAEVSTVENSTKTLAIVVVSRFNSEMNLNTEQKQKMSEIIGHYLDEKAKIIPLMNANKSEYDEKQASYFKTLRVKLKDVLVRAQLQKFMLLKPKPADTDSSLYYVYY
jgi:hypothetical protein